MSQSISETTTTCLSVSTSVYIEPIALAENFGAAIDIYFASATATGITITNAGTLDGEISASGPLALGIAEANFDTKAPHYSSITPTLSIGRAPLSRVQPMEYLSRRTFLPEKQNILQSVRRSRTPARSMVEPPSIMAPPTLVPRRACISTMPAA